MDSNLNQASTLLDEGILCSSHTVNTPSLFDLKNSNNHNHNNNKNEVIRRHY